MQKNEVLIDSAIVFLHQVETGEKIVSGMKRTGTLFAKISQDKWLHFRENGAWRDAKKHEKTIQTNELCIGKERNDFNIICNDFVKSQILQIAFISAL